MSVSRGRSKKAGIVLDPGHGGYDGGASGFGLTESYLTLSIANYCRAALQQYSGVTVYMTRTDDSYVDLKARTNYASSVGADAIISIHINSSDASSAHGAEVWYPNTSSYYYGLHDAGASLSESILNKITALGLTYRGIQTRDYGDDGSEPRYPDGSMSDYYAIIRRARQNGYLGIIVEHAFISNPSDAAFLAQESNLKKLGEADAAGIAQAFGLSKGRWEQSSNGKWRYLIGDDVQTGWINVNGLWYWGDPDDDGICVSSCWKQIDGKWYWFEDSCAMASGCWKLSDGIWYYLSSSGARQTGWLAYQGSWYYLDHETGAMATGWTEVGESKYYLRPDGSMETGWHLEDGDWYYLASDGSMARGWALVGDTWYYLDPETGAMETGWVEMSGSRYYLSQSGSMLTGWLLDGGKWYYLDPSGFAHRGWAYVNGSWYYLDHETGAMATGWTEVGESKYYLRPDGSMETGWHLEDGDWYYLASDGSMARGWALVGDTWYYLDSTTGKMKTGWANIGGSTYYLEQSGAMRTGWLFFDSNWYFFSDSGLMINGWAYIAGQWYWFDEDGKMATGAKLIDGTWSRFSQSGNWNGYAEQGWFNQDGIWYWFGSDGSLAKGWNYISGSWYYFNLTSGAMSTGWLNLEQNWYHLSSSGAMVTGWKEIDSRWNYFDNSGVWQERCTQTSQTIMGSASASESELVNQMCSAFNGTGHQYPSSELAPGGAPSIDAFCEILYEEAVSENVKPELVFCQAMKETGWLQFGGIVKASEFNFAGLGATDVDPNANVFPDVRTGLRAQVQHLVAYANDNASESALHNPLVDKRFNLVNKGCARYIQYLGIPDNPLGCGWASAAGYGCDIVQMMSQAFAL